jgi:recombinational DNA repair protein RecR
MVRVALNGEHIREALENPPPRECDECKRLTHNDTTCDECLDARRLLGPDIGGES